MNVHWPRVFVFGALLAVFFFAVAEIFKVVLL